MHAFPAIAAAAAAAANGLWRTRIARDWLLLLHTAWGLRTLGRRVIGRSPEKDDRFSALGGQWVLYGGRLWQWRRVADTIYAHGIRYISDRGDWKGRAEIGEVRGVVAVVIVVVVTVGMSVRKNLTQPPREYTPKNDDSDDPTLRLPSGRTRSRFIWSSPSSPGEPLAHDPQVFPSARRDSGIVSLFFRAIYVFTNFLLVRPHHRDNLHHHHYQRHYYADLT